MDTAHQVANAYGNDGRNFGPEDVSLAISGMILDEGPTELQRSDLIGSTIEAAAMRFAFGGNAP